MIPIWAAIAGAGAIKGALDAKSAKKKQEKHDAFRKTAMQYSPWTGMGDVGAGNFGNTDALSGALGGGLKGFAMGSTINSMAGMPKLAKSPWAGMAMNYKAPSMGAGRMA